MEYHEAANFLFDLRRYPPRPGTEATRDLLAHLGDLHEEVAFVQVAGSNGKGSTARMVESVLGEAGLTVGLYTSPHIEDIRERVRVDERRVSKAAVCEFVEAVRPYVVERGAEGDAPTFFETVTALALREFGRRRVDVGVVEVGIGGRHDATSVVDPAASAVTNVTREHTDYLGDTIEEIARDKAHVAPADAPLVTAATGEALAAVRDEVGDVLTVGGDGADVRAEYGGRRGLEGAISLSGPDWGVETRLPLLGAHQAHNAGVAAALARQVADVVGADVTEADLARGLRRAHWPGRFEVMGREPLVVIDGAHNPGGCERLAETLAEFEYDDLHLVVGAMGDKDHAGMARALPEADHVVACRPEVPRAEDEDVIAAAFEDAGHGNVGARPAVADALDDALGAAASGDCVLVAGSLYAVGEARQRWTRPRIPKRIDGLEEARATLADADVTDADIRRARGKVVHRVLETRVRARQARRLREELLSLGGECAVSGLSRQDEEVVDAVLAGTLAQFECLLERLDGQPYGLSTLADEVRTALDVGSDAGSDAGNDPAGGVDGREYPWQDGTAVMGILNVTPDSFHDGGEYNTVQAAVKRAERLVEAGAAILDVGGESTRPGAEPVSVAEERGRVVPVIEELAGLDAMVSVDTRKAAVARAALEAGADLLNDVSGLEDPEMAPLAAEHGVPLVVMHSVDTPVDPDREVAYDDVVEDALRELRERVLLAERAGLDRERILVDPGIGFGKSSAESFELIDRLGEFSALGCPVVVGHSHKSMFGLIGRGPGERLPATVAVTALAADRGADVVRVHDVPENVAAVRAAAATRDPESLLDD